MLYSFFLLSFLVGSLSYLFLSITGRQNRPIRIFLSRSPLLLRLRPHPNRRPLPYPVWSRLFRLLTWLEGGTVRSVRVPYLLFLFTLLYTLLLLPLLLLPLFDLFLPSSFSVPVGWAPSNWVVFAKWVYLSNHPYETWSGYTQHFFVVDRFNIKKTGLVEASKLLHTTSYIRFWSKTPPLMEFLSLLLLSSLPAQLYTLSKLGSYSSIWSWDKRLRRRSHSHTVALFVSANELCYKTNLLLLPLLLLHLFLILLLVV